MTQNRRKEILAIMESILELPVDARADYLDKRCGKDPDLRREIETRLDVETNRSFEGPLVSNSQDPDLIGSHIGPYRILKELGVGGMGSVYLAEREGRLKMSVAIKLIRSNLASSGFQQWFYREQQVLADLKHPHIAMLLDAGEYKNRPYFIMEHIEGQTIDKWEGRHQLGHLLNVMCRVIAAVGFAHDKGVIHRDIKPGNLMVNTENQPKLLDFGIAELTKSSQSQDPNPTVAMTPEYASPEQKSGAPVGFNSDIYSLGLVLLQLLTGKRPSDLDSSPGEEIESLSQPRATPEIESTLTPDFSHPIPEALCHVLRHALREDPTQRYQHAALFLKDLQRVISRLPKESPDVKKPYDLLVWNHPDDESTALQIRQYLQSAGFKVWCAPQVGSSQLTATEISALAVTSACVVCLGPGPISPWLGDIEFRDGLSFQSDTIHIVPVLLPGAAFPERQSQLPDFLRNLAWVNLIDLNDPQNMEQLESALLPQDDLEVTLEGVCPFRGLEVFREQDSHVFFGREPISQRILIHLEQHHFIAVLGPSGSGKSSVVQAGVLPALRQKGFIIALFTPTQKPLEELAYALFNLYRETTLTPSVESILTRLRTSDEALVAMARELAETTGKRILLVLDQFEEIFTLTQTEETRTRLVTNLCNSVDPDKVSLLITMRSDFLGKCIAYPDLNKFVTENLIQVEPMSREALTRAINIPARMAGLHMEPGLLEKVLDDVAGSSAELPLLEHALMELYEHREGNRLTRHAYGAIGGIEGALAQRAEAQYEMLDPSARLTLRKMFTLCLIQPGEGVEDTRRRAEREELLAVGDPVVVAQILTAWTQSRLLTGSGMEGRGQELIDVAHEALIRRWGRIKTWMDEDREITRLISRLRQYARTWDASGRNEDLLLRGAPLLQMEDLLTKEGDRLSTLETTFIREGVTLQQRNIQADQEAAKRLRRRKNQAQGAGIFALLLALVTIILFFRASEAEQNALVEKSRADQQRDHAERKTREANYHLGIALNKEAGAALEEQQPQKAWLLSLAALSQDIPDNKNLSEPRGRFVDPSLGGINNNLWTSPVRVRTKHVASSPDGHFLALAGFDNFIRILDTHTGVQTHLLHDATQSILQMSFSPDGRLLAATSDRKQLYLWDTVDWQAEIFDDGHRDRVLSPTFSNDNELLATVDEHGRILIRHLNDRTNPLTLDSGDRAAWLTFLDGKLFMGFENGSIEAHTPFAPDPNALLVRKAGPSPIVGMAPYGRNQLAVANADGALSLYDTAGNLLSALSLDLTLTNMTCEEGSQAMVFSTSTAVYTINAFSDSSPQPLHASGLHQLTLVNEILSGCDEKGELIRYRMGDSDVLDQLDGFAGRILFPAYSPDGHILAAGALDGDIILWDREWQTKVLRNHSQAVYEVTFSPDGNYLASCSVDQTIIIWDMPEATPKRVLTGHSDTIYGVAFSPDGTQLASASADKTIRMWDLTSSDPPKVLMGHEGIVFSVDFHPNGRQLASSSGDQTIRLWDLSDEFKYRELKGHKGMIFRVTYSRDGSLLASASFDGTARLWHPYGPKPPQILQDHKAAVFGVAFSPDSKSVVTASGDQTLMVHPLPNPTQPRILRGHTASAVGVVFSPDSKKLVSTSSDSTVKLWDISSFSKPAVLSGHEGSVIATAFSPDGQQLASTSVDRTIRIWDMPFTKPPRILKGHSKRISDVAFSPDGDSLVSVAADGDIRFWDLTSDSLIRTIRNPDLNIIGVDFSPDGKRIATGSDDHLVKLWELDDTKPPQVLKGHQNTVIGIDFSPDGNTLASGAEDNTVRVWDLTDMGSSTVLEGHSAWVYGVDFSPDGKQLASASEDRTVRLWDVDRARPINVLRGHEGRVYGVAFSPDGLWLASSSEDRTVRIWNTMTGEEYATLSGHKGEVNWFIDFSPDGSLLASPSDDKTVRLWQMDRLPTPPVGKDPREWYAGLLQRSLYQLGYRLDGIQLYHQPHIRLKGISRTLAPSPYDHLDHPRPPEQEYVDWLLQDPHADSSAKPAVRH